jgi:hypothetical protein
MTQFHAPAYDIQRPTGQCAFTGRKLEPGEPYIAALVEIDPEAEPPASAGKTPATGVKGAVSSAAAALGMRRLDISTQAWDQGQRPSRLFSFWRSTVPQPNQKRKLLVDDDVLLNLFRRLQDADGSQRQAFRFVLGLILMRKRLLRYDGSFHKTVGQVEQEWWRVTPRAAPGTGVPGSGGYEAQTLELLNPQLDDQKVQEVTLQLGEVLEAQL